MSGSIPQGVLPPGTPTDIASLARIAAGDSGNAVKASGAVNLLYYQDAFASLGSEFAREMSRRTEPTSENVQQPSRGMRYCGEGEDCTDPFALEDDHYNPPNHWSSTTGQYRAPQISEVPIMRATPPGLQPPATAPPARYNHSEQDGRNVYVPSEHDPSSRDRVMHMPAIGAARGGETAIVRESASANACPPQDMCRDGALIGCNIVGNSGGSWSHRKLNMTREPATRVDEVYVQQAAVADYATSNASATVQRHLQPYGNYTETLYSTPTLDAERRISTGVIINPWTGQMYETFEDDVPPPNTDRSLMPDQFGRTNPKLVAMKGGRDPNRDYASKREPCQRLPGDDGGENVWGDALYADRRREDMQQRANRTVWHNRDGDYQEPAWDKKSNGYVGWQRAYQNFPYLPQTQQLDLQQWVGPVTEQGVMPNRAMAIAAGGDGDDPYRIVARVQYNGTDLSECTHNGGVETGITNFGEQLPFQGELLPTQKEGLMSQQFATHGADGQTQTGEKLQFQGKLLPTSKTLMQQQFATHGADGQTQTGEQLPFQGSILPTLKTLMQKSFPTHGLDGQTQTGEQLPFQGTMLPSARKTQTMEAQFPTLNAALANSGLTGEFEHGVVSMHNFRGQGDEQYAHVPISQVPVQTGGANWTPFATSQRDTKRRTQQPSARPGEYSFGDKRWMSELSAPCVAKGERESTYARSHEGRFGSITEA
jgi:hypothetical protein